MMERVPIEVDVSWIMPQRGIASHRVVVFRCGEDRLSPDGDPARLLLLLFCVTKVCCKEGSKEQ
jgi:hypothetical protein